MISEKVMDMLGTNSGTAQMPEKMFHATLFSDYKGDSVIVRIFRGGGARDPQEQATKWLNEAKEQCNSLVGELVTATVSFPAHGGEMECNNVVAIIGGYDILTTEEMQEPIDDDDTMGPEDFAGWPGTVSIERLERAINYVQTHSDFTLDGEVPPSGDETLDRDIEMTAESMHNVDFALRVDWTKVDEMVREGNPTACVEFLTVTINDDESAGVSIIPDTLRVDEGESKTYKMSLDAEPSHDVTVTLTVTGSSDVTTSPTPAVTFTTGNWTDVETVTVSAAQDTDALDDEATIGHTSASTDPAFNNLTIDSVAVTVNDDEDLPVTVEFEDENHSVAEGASINIKVKLSQDPERQVIIPLSAADKDGASDADYTAIATSVTFNSGDTEKTFSFAAAQDNADDDDEKVEITFGSPLPNAVTEGTKKKTTVTITDNDDPVITVQFDNDNYSVEESDDPVTTGIKENETTVTVTLSANPEREVVIPIRTTNKGGISTADYTGVPTTLTFASGETEKSFTFQALHDTGDDDDEGLELRFGSLPAGVNPGTPNSTVVAINDDDLPEIKLSFARSQHNVPEGGSLSIEISADREPERTVTVNITAAGRDGATASDYTAPTSATLGAGDTSTLVLFLAADDSEQELDELVDLTLQDPTDPRTTIGDTGTTTITIVDNDSSDEDLQVTWQNPTHQVEEGETVTVAAQLNRQHQNALTVPITKRHFDGTEPQDYSGIPDNITFQPGSTRENITFTAVEDEIREKDEKVLIQFGTMPPNLTNGSPLGTEITIKDDDANPIRRNIDKCPDQAGLTVVLDVTGTIAKAGESGFWRMEMDPYRIYLLEAIGAGSGDDIMGNDTVPGDLTLPDPDIIALWNADRSYRLEVYSPVVDNAGNSTNSILPTRITQAGHVWLEVAASENSAGAVTGTYQVKMRVNNICDDRSGTPHYPWDGGPEGYAHDVPGDTTTVRSARLNTRTGGFLGDNWEQAADEDWYRIEMEPTMVYTITAEANGHYPNKHQATEIRITGIHDSVGELIHDTASDGAGPRVSVTFSPETRGRYHLGVGHGQKDPDGVYSIHITAKEKP